MVQPFDPAQHLAEVTAWRGSRGDPTFTADILPRVGFIEPGVAAGWMYQTDSRVGFLEEFVTNPKASGKARHAAVDEIGLALIAHAKSLGLLRLFVHTAHRSIGRMCIRRGFAYRGPSHVLSVEV
jgi:hypothetical protein